MGFGDTMKIRFDDKGTGTDWMEEQHKISLFSTQKHGTKNTRTHKYIILTHTFNRCQNNVDQNGSVQPDAIRMLKFLILEKRSLWYGLPLAYRRDSTRLYNSLAHHALSVHLLPDEVKMILQNKQKTDRVEAKIPAQQYCQ